LEPDILNTWDIAELLEISAGIFWVVVLVFANPDAISVLLVKSRMEILLADTFDGLEVVHVKVVDPDDILAPTSNVVDCPVILNAVNEGD
jgi:hypothetical protein